MFLSENHNLPRISKIRAIACLIALLLPLLLLASGCNQKNSSPSPPPSSSSGTTPAPSPNQDKLLFGKVTRVVDGDTAHVLINGQDYTVRFIGVNTPEIEHPSQGIKEQPYGREAKEYTTRRLQNKQIWLELDVQEKDKYGRLLAYVWLEPPAFRNEEEIKQKMFNAELLREGYAQLMTVPPNVKYEKYFVKLQQEARQKKKGLWGL